MRAAVLLSLCASALAGSWHVVSKSQVGDDSFDVSFFNATSGFVGGSNPLIGSDVWATSDGGVTFTSIDFSLFDLTATAVAASGVGIVCGDFGVQFTNNFGVNWTQAAGDVADCVTARRTGFGGFAVVGELGLVSDVLGCAISSDGGATFNVFDASSVAQYAPLYGAFPTASTWYLSAGGTDANGAPVGGQILKTADAGNSWTVALTTADATRTVGIDCADASNCCAALVDATGNASISCSHDGGASWTLGYNVSGDANTLINDIRATPSGWWAIGGDYPSSGWVLHSTAASNGAVWTIDTTLPYYGSAIDVAPDGSLWGLVFESVGDDSFANYVIAGQ